ncbi:hypothetical protein [Desulfatibacillum aliphaticivorans]|uniref:hypothetical protein n=1 Tax=Desulfatibacillum aliphaticivorans TaxID=218208 RepID=UPI0004825234|nr:hypothetical protein [Desulfatibacillum aliphaticivorans]
MERNKLRNVVRLCLYCLRHMAYYRAGWSGGSLIIETQFWKGVNGNFIDICVIEWCKLFGDLRGKHCWRKVVSDPNSFLDGLLQNLELTEDAFEDYIKEMKIYRDKYVAHLDSFEKVQIPKLDFAKKSVLYLYNYLLVEEDQGQYFHDAPKDVSQFYEKAFKEGLSVYQENA